jgi:SAM-dependent methyltransferase
MMAMHVRFQLPPKGSLQPNHPVKDPLPFYYKPITGRLFCARIDTGLRLLDGLPRFRRLLEIGYGSGLLMPTLAAATDELYGADLASEPPGLREALKRLGVEPRELRQADIRALPYADGFFDGVVAFSIFEHLRPNELRAALVEVARVLEPGGHLLVGCPAVHKAMNAAFSAIGFSGIERLHFSSLADVARNATARFDVVRRGALPSLLARAPLGWAPYGALLLRKR